MDLCYYCKTEPSIGSLPHPRFKNQVMPTCDHCYKHLNLYSGEFKVLGRIGCVFGPASLAIAAFLAANRRWQATAIAVLVAVMAVVVSAVGTEHFRKKRDKATGDYVDTKAIRWCRTCRFFRKSREYEDTIKGAWHSVTMPDDTVLPCKNLQLVRGVWADYYAQPHGKRALFPKNCSQWTGR